MFKTSDFLRKYNGSAGKWWVWAALTGLAIAAAALFDGHVIDKVPEPALRQAGWGRGRGGHRTRTGMLPASPSSTRHRHWYEREFQTTPHPPRRSYPSRQLYTLILQNGLQSLFRQKNLL